jgi:hypothetical protein
MRDIEVELSLLKERVPDPHLKYTRVNVNKLTILLMSHDEQMTGPLNSTTYFNQIRAIYRDWCMNYSDNPEDLDLTLRILLAVACSGSLFTESQRKHLRIWKNNVKYNDRDLP